MHKKRTLRNPQSIDKQRKTLQLQRLQGRSILERVRGIELLNMGVKVLINQHIFYFVVKFVVKLPFNRLSKNSSVRLSAAFFSASNKC